LVADPALAARVDEQKGALIAASLEYMPRDRFWEDRYGDRGRRFANEDAAFHLQYLSEALRAGSQAVLDNYGRWLRGVLVARGMATRHLQEHFEHLASALDRVIGDPVPGVAMRGAAAALDYDEPAAAAIQRAARDAGGHDGHSGFAPAMLTHYVADAVARDDRSTLVAHLRWARVAFARAHGGDAAGFDAVLDRVAAALTRDRAAAPGVAMLDDARRAAMEPPAA